jgi:hypothetical protein
VKYDRELPSRCVYGPQETVEAHAQVLLGVESSGRFQGSFEPNAHSAHHDRPDRSIVIA